MKNKYHETVLLNEVLENVDSGKVIDCTLGTGGHSLGLVNKSINVLGIEADPRMLEIAKERLGNSITAVLGNFVDLEKIAKENNFTDVDAILFDLGVSNLHLKNDNRGFSFTEAEQDLDMRLNPNLQGVKASDLLNALDKTQLTNLFAVVMKYKDAKNLAVKVFENRPLKTVGDLKKLCHGVGEKRGLDSATLPMLALRIAVNSELSNIEEVLPKAFSLLRKGGKLLVITFHSGEHLIMDKFKLGVSKYVTPSEDEIYQNPRARSARLYIVTK